MIGISGLHSKTVTPPFDFGWRPIRTDGLARHEGLLGPQAVKVGDVYWRKVRLGFFRPLVQFKEYTSASLSIPSSALFGGAQFAVAPGDRANSFLNCMLFEDTRRYALDSLDANRNRQVRTAAKCFCIRPINDLHEFKRAGHAAYLSFHERTQYSYGSKRRDPAIFSAWADALFDIPEILVLGAYDHNALVGVSVSYLVDETVSYAAFFCTTGAMRSFVSDLMLHAIRTAASRDPSVNAIFAGMYKGHNGLDRFYLLRGARCIRKPAMLRINPVVQLALRYAAPSMYSKLMGHLPAAASQVENQPMAIAAEPMSLKR